MKILAIDPGVTQAGFAVLDIDHPDRERGMICSSFTSTGTSAERKAEQFGRHLDWLIRHYAVDFICFEEAVRKIFRYGHKDDLGGQRDPTPSSDQLILAELQGHIRQAAISHVLPYDSVQVRTWRAAVYGEGGNKMERNKAKAYARQMCRQMGIEHRNHNEAEAAMVAFWCATCSQVYKARLYGLAI